MCLTWFSSYEPRFTLTWCNLYTKHMLRPDIQNGPVKCLLLEALLTLDILWSSEELLQRSRCAVAPSSNDAARCQLGGGSTPTWREGSYRNHPCCGLDIWMPKVPHSVFAGEYWVFHAVIYSAVCGYHLFTPAELWYSFQSYISGSD